MNCAFTLAVTAMLLILRISPASEWKPMAVRDEIRPRFEVQTNTAGIAE